MIGVASSRDDAVIALEQSANQCLLCLNDGASRLAIELDRNVSDTPGRNIFGNVLFATSNNTHRNDSFSCRREEARIRRGEAGGLQLGHQFTERLLVIYPAQELPNHAEVFDLVDERSSRQGNQQRVLQTCANCSCNSLNVLGALGLFVLDEVGLIDHHSPKIKFGQPAHVAIENVVVHDKNIAERIELGAVPVNHSGAPLRQPLVNFPQPVRLHHVRDHHQQWESSRNFGGNERLSGLAQAGLIGEEETPVTTPH